MNEAQALSYSGSRDETPVLETFLRALDKDMIELAAQALFECVFSRCERLDGKHYWMNCDEDIKDGFRGEAMAVIRALNSFMMARAH